MGGVLCTGCCGEDRPPNLVEPLSLPRLGCPENTLEETRLAEVESHAKEKKLLGGVYRQSLGSLGSFCKECRTSVHEKCEATGFSKSLNCNKQRSTLPRGFSESPVISRVMEGQYNFNLTYITERIISVFFPPLLEEQCYSTQLKEVSAILKSKHQDTFLLFNLSEMHQDITHFGLKVRDFGWPDLHAPPLDKICAVCKAMESWLTSDPQHVVVLLCKGNKGKTGVVITAFMQYSKISAGAEKALGMLAMRKFCEDKVSSALQPSQNRYINYFGGLLSGAIKINANPLFLHQVLVPSLPNFQPNEGYFPFLKIYQSMQLIYTSGIYDLHGSVGRRLCVTIQPALQLKGDILVKCYNVRAQGLERDTVFRLQFNTCTVHGVQLWFGKEELDDACTDDRFPSDATVEFVFSSGPEKIKGREYQRNDPAVTVDYNIGDPVVRWDSYENINQHQEDSREDISHTRGPLDGSLYAQVKKRPAPGPAPGPGPLAGGDEDKLCQSASFRSVVKNSSPPHLDPRRPPALSHQEREELIHLLGGIEGKRAGRGRETGQDRETAILDDRDHAPSENPRAVGVGYFPRHCREPACKRSLTLPNGYHPDRCDPAPSSFFSSSQLLNHNSRYRPGPPCPQRSCSDCLTQHACPYPARDARLPSQAHTLPSFCRNQCRGKDCVPFNQSSCTPHSQHTNLHRESLQLEGTLPPGCPCRDCCSAAEGNAFHALRLNQGTPCGRGERLHRGMGLKKDGDSEDQQERERETEIWHQRPTVISCGPHELPDGNLLPCGYPAYPEPSRSQSYSSSHSHLDQSYSSSHSHLEFKHSSGSSGCQTPRRPYPCSPFQPPSSQSRGYTSGYQSESTSPLLTHAASSTLSLHSIGPSGGLTPPLGPPEAQADGTSVDLLGVGESLPERDQISQGSLEDVHMYGQSAFSPPLELSRPSSPVHTSSPLCHQRPSQAGTEVFVKELHIIPGNVSSQDMGHSSPQASHSLCSGPFPIQPPNRDPANIALAGIDRDRRGSPVPSLPHPANGHIQHSHRLGAECTADMQAHHQTDDSQTPSPVPDGYCTPSFPLPTFYYPVNIPAVPCTGYTAVSIPAPRPQPPLPEKHHLYTQSGSPDGRGSPLKTATGSHGIQPSVPPIPQQLTSPASEGELSSPVGPPAGCSHTSTEKQNCLSAKFVQDSSRFWYKPKITRDQAFAVLKEKEPGAFLIRDSNSFQGAYGLALKIAAPPHQVISHVSKGNPLEQLVRHFLIEKSPRGVKIKGCPKEPHFGSLSALVYQHSITPISLPCILRVPDKDPAIEVEELQAASNTSTAAELLKQGAACNVLYLNSVETESLTGPQAISKASSATLSQNPRPSATVVHFKVSVQGVTLTDNQRRVFFRRHYPVNSMTFSSVDPHNRRWTNSDSTTSRIFGFVAKKSGSSSENVCHLFAELDSEQPAVAIVNFINKVLLGPQLR